MGPKIYWELNAALYNIKNGSVQFPYTSIQTDVWDILKNTEKDTVNQGVVISKVTENQSIVSDRKIIIE